MGDVVESRTDRFFKIALVLKGLDGAVELVAAVVLLLVPAAALNQLVAEIVSHDLVGPPDGFLARHLVAGTAEFASGNRAFVLAYLGMHGIIKVGLVVALLTRYRPAYPVAIGVLGVLIAFEVTRAVRTGSAVLPFAAALDILILVLVVREYRAMGR